MREVTANDVELAYELAALAASAAQSGGFRRRDSARVIVLDPDSRVLLCRIVDPVGGGPPVWLTPGGGIEAGESIGETAARELAEETGLCVSPADLGPPVAVTRGEWSFRGTRLYSEDWYFAVHTQSFAPVPQLLTAIEAEVTERWEWFTPEEVTDSPELIIPGGLADLIEQLGTESPAEPIVLPWVSG